MVCTVHVPDRLLLWAKWKDCHCVDKASLSCTPQWIFVEGRFVN